ncbi:MAG TPA: IPT/TIG domain-containing protein [Longimicrobium sp.]
MLSTVTPAVLPRGGAEAVLTVRGSGFVQQSTVRLNGADRPTELVSATELRARMAAADLADHGRVQATVATPAPGGGVSGVVELTVANPAPLITSLAPSTLVAGTPGTVVTLTGTGFVRESEVMVSGALRPAVYVSPTELRVPVTPNDARLGGQAVIRVLNTEPGGGFSPEVVLPLVNPAPSITALSPTVLTATLSPPKVTVTGSGFTVASQVFVGPSGRSAAFLSPGELEVTLMPVDVAAGGTLEVRVVNPAPGGGTAGATLEVRAPVPVVTGVDQGQAVAGTPGMRLHVIGAGFATNAEARFNGSARPTQVASPTQLEITLTAADLQAAGSYTITVANPGPGGGVSNAVAFLVVGPVRSVVQPSPAGTGPGAPAPR